MRSIRYLLALAGAALLLVIPAAAQAAPTDTDGSFGTAGFTWFTSSSSINTSYQMDYYETWRARSLADGGYISLDGDVSDVEESRYVRRLDAAGNPVASFGAGGTATIDFIGSGRSFFASDITESGEGHLLVFGSKQASSPFKPTVLKLDSATGAIATAYGSGGYYELPVPGGQTQLVVAQRCNLGGEGVCFVTSSTTGAAAVGKLAPDGSISGSVGTIDLSPLGYTKFYPEDAVADGTRLLISGSADNASDSAGPLPVVVAITSSGPDPSFGSGGVAQLDMSGGDVNRIASSPAGGFAVLMSNTKVAKVTSSGVLDSAFGYHDCEPAPCNYDSLAVGTDGTIVAGGYKSTVPHTRISRFKPSGEPDATFGDSGNYGMSLGTGAAMIAGDESASFVHIDSLGRIVYRAAGVKHFGYNNEVADRTASVFGRLVGTPPAGSGGSGGGSAQPEPAKALFAGSLKSKLKARKLKTIKGTASGTGLTRVELAIQRVDSKLLKKSKKCSYFKSTKLSIKKVRAVKGKCAPSVWIKATGTASWALRLKKALRPGKYVLSVRATGLAGVGAVKTKKLTLTK